jgi:hypothetical protein
MEKDKAQDEASKGRHPAWDYVDVTRNDSSKKKCFTCRICSFGSESQTIITRWASHIIGRPVAGQPRMGIQACTGGKTEESRKLWKEAKARVAEHDEQLSAKREEDAKKDRLQRQLDAQDKALEKVPLPSDAGPSGTRDPRDFQQSVLSFDGGAKGTSSLLQSEKAKSSNAEGKKRKKPARPEHEDANDAVGDFFYGCNVPFSVADSSPFKRMCQALMAVNPKHGEYETPSSYKIKGKMLDKKVSSLPRAKLVLTCTQ